MEKHSSLSVGCVERLIQDGAGICDVSAQAESISDNIIDIYFESQEL